MFAGSVSPMPDQRRWIRIRQTPPGPGDVGTLTAYVFGEPAATGSDPFVNVELTTAVTTEMERERGMEDPVPLPEKGHKDAR